MDRGTTQRRLVRHRGFASFADVKPKWVGPFETIETACLAIARRLAVEIADRHTRSLETHKIGHQHPLYGFIRKMKL